MISAKAVWSITGLTGGDGPVVVGYAYGDYTVAEIKEAIEASSAIDLGDKVAQERAKRMVRVVGSFSESGGSALNDGKPITTKLNWRFNASKACNIFAYNDGGALLTTGAIVNHNGTLWVKDV